jgi:uncharacterized protein (DUF983 family)
MCRCFMVNQTKADADTFYQRGVLSIVIVGKIVTGLVLRFAAVWFLHIFLIYFKSIKNSLQYSRH